MTERLLLVLCLGETVNSVCETERETGREVWGRKECRGQEKSEYKYTGICKCIYTNQTK